MGNIRLKSISTKPPESANEESVREENILLRKRIGELQQMLYAESSRGLLVIMQGMDASGKDGAIKGVFSEVNPMGVRVIAFKKPTEVEYAHDFLWRIHAETPPHGMIHVFNRSHYEDIVIPTVKGYIPKHIISKRFEAINNFEEMLQQNGTTVMKFYLHVSHDEQQVRLKERMTNPKKFWKHKDEDWENTRHWDDFMEIYSKVINDCDVIPWNIVPADKNWYKENQIAKSVLTALEKIDPKYPPLATEMKKKASV
jgi:PPK2 family polyphosphate:nucleotide phosphotransferase